VSCRIQISPATAEALSVIIYVPLKCPWFLPPKPPPIFFLSLLLAAIPLFSRSPPSCRSRSQEFALSDAKTAPFSIPSAPSGTGLGYHPPLLSKEATLVFGNHQSDLLYPNTLPYCISIAIPAPPHPFLPGLSVFIDGPQRSDKFPSLKL